MSVVSLAVHVLVSLRFVYALDRLIYCDTEMYVPLSGASALALKMCS